MDRNVHTLRRIALFLLIAGACLGASTALAADTAAAAVSPPKSAWMAVLQYMVAHAFGLAITLVFVTAIVSSYLSRRLSDRCMKHMEGFPVTLEFKDGRRERGALDAENNGLEIIFDDPKRDDSDGPNESLLVYTGEYGQVQAVVCFTDALDDKQRKRRQRDIKRAYAPSFWRRQGRKLRNFFAAIKDAFAEAFVLVLGRLKSAGPQAEALKSQEKYVQRMGNDVIGTATAAGFDPLLERQIGRTVTVEAKRADSDVMFVKGILKDYSKEFLELQDVQYPDAWTETLSPLEMEAETLGVSVWRQGGELAIDNGKQVDITVEFEALPTQSDGAGEGPKPVTTTMKVAAGQQSGAPLPNPDAPVSLRVTCVKPADIIFPRHSAVVRGRKSRA